MIVRAATGEDALAIMRVRNASWRATYGLLLPPGVWDDADPVAAAARLATRLDDGSLSALVADSDATVRGYAMYGPCRDDDLPGAGEVYAIYADPAYWSTGVGRALMPAAVEALGVRPVVLWVLVANERARRFYERGGFRADAAVKDAEMPGGVLLPEMRYRLD